MTTMRESPVNRLEPHWPTYATRPQAPEYDPVSWSEMANSWEVRLQRFLGEHPKLTVAAAAAAGLMLGWMVKRK
jgi:hypothetical protein